MLIFAVQLAAAVGPLCVRLLTRLDDAANRESLLAMQQSKPNSQVARQLFVRLTSRP